jgi:choline dehydrogenase
VWDKLWAKVDPHLAARVTPSQLTLIHRVTPLLVAALSGVLALSVVGLGFLLWTVGLVAVVLGVALLRPLANHRDVRCSSRSSHRSSIFFSRFFLFFSRFFRFSHPNQTKKSSIHESSAAAHARRFSHAKISDSYDFVVVGAGSAGCVLARKLADGGFSVLLIESGRDEHTRSEVSRDLPGWFGLLTNDRFDYDLTTDVQPGMAARKLQYGRGHVLGGSSTINALMWVLGHEADFNDWANKHGATGWDWATLKPHFHALESFADGAEGARGKSGPFSVRTVGQKSAQHTAFLKAAVACGIKANADYNSGDNSGIALCQQNSRADNTRCDAFTAMIEPYLARTDSRNNLHVVDEARVERILFDGDTATGVVFKCSAWPGLGAFSVRARREVLLSAGAVHTPQLLMLSGIGPAAELKKHGIRVRVDAPGVGANCHDHVACAVNVHLKDEISSDPAIADGTGFNVTGFFQSSWSAKNEPSRGPDMQIVGIACPPFIANAAPMTLAMKLLSHAERGSLRGAAFRNLMQLAKTLLVNTGGLAKIAKHSYSVGVVLNHPSSVGSLRLKSASVDDQPLFDFALLSTDEDKERMYEAVCKAIDVLKSADFYPLVDKFDADEQALLSKDRAAVLAHVAQRGSHAWHICGTVRMGSASDKLAPLTPDLKVKGVKGLRVIDASCMPKVTSGNTNVPSLLIGSRGAEIVLAEHKKN